MKLNITKQCLSKNDRELKLTQREFQLVLILALNFNREFLSRVEIYNMMGTSLQKSTRGLDVNVFNINKMVRKFLHKPSYKLIDGIYNCGYRLLEPLEIVLNEQEKEE